MKNRQYKKIQTQAELDKSMDNTNEKVVCNFN